MENLARYQNCFRRAFQLEDDEIVDSFAYQDNAQWDSVGHLTLITEIENEFELQFDVDDVIDFSSFRVGKEIIEKYGIGF